MSLNFDKFKADLATLGSDMSTGFAAVIAFLKELQTHQTDPADQAVIDNAVAAIEGLDKQVKDFVDTVIPPAPPTP